MSNQLRVALIGAGICTLLTAKPAFAVEFKTDSFEGNFNSTISIGGGRRTNDPSCSIVGSSAACGSSANPAQWSGGDDGNLNYGKGDWFTAYVKGIHELLVKNDDGYKLFARATWKKDFKADDTRRTDLSPEAKRQIVNNFEVLDLWVSKNLSIGGESARVKLGNQVISWGEALFFVGGVSNNVLDWQKLLVPGTQMKEAFLPVPAISLSSTLGGNFSGEAYYQFRFRRNRMAPVGSYFSASEGYDKGRVPVAFNGLNFNTYGTDQYTVTGQRSLSEADAMAAIAANGDFPVPFLNDRKTKNSGQFGMSVKWAPEDSRVNFGAFFQNYHDPMPVLDVTNGGTAYQWRFLENRKMFGLTANFPVGDWAVGTELSYRPKDAIALGSCFGVGGPLDANTNTASFDCPLWKDNKKFQLSTTAMLQLQKSQAETILGALGADTAFITAEAAITRYPGASKPIYRNVGGVAVQQVAAAGYFAPLDRSDPNNPIAARIGTETSWGYVVDFNWTYDGKLIKGWQVTPGITLSHSVKGDTPNYAAQFLEDNKSLNFYILFNQNPAVWQAGMNYTNYLGGKNDVVNRQYFKDRDFFGGFVSYSF